MRFKIERFGTAHQIPPRSPQEIRSNEFFTALTKLKPAQHGMSMVLPTGIPCCYVSHDLFGSGDQYLKDDGKWLTPVMVLGHLGVTQKHQGNGLGAGLLKDAVTRTQSVAQYFGIRALLAHAMTEHSISFLKHYGFVQSPIQEHTYLLRVA